MGVKNLTVAILTLNVLIFFDISPSIKAYGEEVPDPVRTPDRIIDPVNEKRFDSFTNGFGESKRGFDEINRSSFGFNKRRNFDEIGRSSFGFNKRRNFDEIGRSSFGFAKRDPLDDSVVSDAVNELDMAKRGDFDEIGRSSFGFYRRSPQAPRSAGWRFFPGFGKRSSYSDDSQNDLHPRAASKRFDEINRSSFGFERRST